MIDENYIEYISKSVTLTKCQKKILTKLKDNLNKFYINRKSNKQILTFITNANQSQDIARITRLKLLFKHFVSFDMIEQLIKQIVNDKLTDYQIVTSIIKFNKNHKHHHNKTSSIMNIEKTCGAWDYIIENLALGINNSINKQHKYLDIGCARGHKTKAFAKELGIEKNNYWGTDIENWGPYKQQEINHDFNFKYILNDGKLDFEDNSFDICTCFLVLHHVENLSNIISEISRVLKPSGMLILVEHDNHDDYDNLILDILHMLYGYIYDSNTNYISNPDYAQYYNWAEWDYIFKKKNFKYQKSNYFFINMTHEIRYDNIYYAIYSNEKNI